MEKVAKGFRKTAAELRCRDREAEDLRAAADRQGRKRRKVVGETGLFLDRNTAAARLDELDRKEREKTRASSRAESRKEALRLGKKTGGYDKERKRVGKGFIVYSGINIVDSKA